MLCFSTVTILIKYLYNVSLVALCVVVIVVFKDFMCVSFFYNKNVELVLLLAVVVADDSLTAL